MRVVLLFLLFVFLFGCAAQQHPADAKEPAMRSFNVSLSSASHSEEFVREQNRTKDTLSFILTNNEDVALDCSMLLKMGNGTDSSEKRGSVGIVAAGDSKNVSLGFEMFLGNTSLKVVPECVAVD